MNFEPQKFFIGLVDFFSILMPGALLAYLGRDWGASVLLGWKGFRLEGTEAWMLFFFASYLLGHFAFLLGALLDDVLYAPLRKCTDSGQIERLAKGEELQLSFRRRLTTGWLFKLVKRWLFKNADAALIQAQRIKARGLAAESAINTYQWCKARLSKDHPDGLVAVHRFEADSKFFRSFAIVLTVLGLIYASQGRLVPVLVCAGFLLPALWRYMEQRFKATQQAYWFIIMLEGLKDIDSSPKNIPPRHRPDGLTHAGGVVFRHRNGTVEYLLVQASKNRSQWVLPKGHIELAEDPRETVVRQVREETGHWARVVEWIEDLPRDADYPLVRFYLMQAAGDVEHAEKSKPTPAENRQHQWLMLAEAQHRASFQESKNLLKQAERLRAEKEETAKS